MHPSYQNIPGTFDVLPSGHAATPLGLASSGTWRHVEGVIHRVMARYGAQEIRTPVLEPVDLIARGVGQGTDIVSKEMFVIERSDEAYVLRPEVTAPVMRAYLQHHLDQAGGSQRLYYMGPCFRAERPQKGRYRQFHQFGLELIGPTDARADAETIACMIDIYRELGLDGFTLRINSLGEAASRIAYREALISYLEPHRDRLTDVSRNRLETNPLRILDTKDASERALLENAPRLSGFIDDECRAHHEELKGHLDALEIVWVEDPFLVRGLDYYSRTAFELEHPSLGAQSSLAGGGRYDGLSVEVGSRSVVPAVGFAAGFERLFLALDALDVGLPDQAPPDVFLVALGEAALSWAVREAAVLRGKGLAVIYDLQGRSMKAQMREANRSGALRVVIVGERELEEKSASVKDMATGDQASVPLEGLAAHLVGSI